MTTESWDETPNHDILLRVYVMKEFKVEEIIALRQEATSQNRTIHDYLLQCLLFGVAHKPRMSNISVGEHLAAIENRVKNNLILRHSTINYYLPEDTPEKIVKELLLRLSKKFQQSANCVFEDDLNRYHIKISTEQ